MSNDDVLFRFRLRVIALAKELGSVREACRVREVHPSSFYRWRKLLERYGPELLRPRERRASWMRKRAAQELNNSFGVPARSVGTLGAQDPSRAFGRAPRLNPNPGLGILLPG
jgi:hypothetical protein